MICGDMSYTPKKLLFKLHNRYFQNEGGNKNLPVKNNVTM